MVSLAETQAARATLQAKADALNTRDRDAAGQEVAASGGQERGSGFADRQEKPRRKRLMMWINVGPRRAAHCKMFLLRTQGQYAGCKG